MNKLIQQILMDKLTQQIIKFVFVGGTSTLLDMGLLYVFTEYVNMHYLIAGTLSFVIATFYNYYLSMKFVFASKFDKGQRGKEFSLFFILSLISLILTIALLALFVDVMHLRVMVAKVVVGVFVMIFSFVTRKIFFE